MNQELNETDLILQDFCKTMYGDEMAYINRLIVAIKDLNARLKKLEKLIGELQ